MLRALRNRRRSILPAFASGTGSRGTRLAASGSTQCAAARRRSPARVPYGFDLRLRRSSRPRPGAPGSRCSSVNPNHLANALGRISCCIFRQTPDVVAPLHGSCTDTPLGRLIPLDLAPSSLDHCNRSQVQAAAEPFDMPVVHDRCSLTRSCFPLIWQSKSCSMPRKYRTMAS